MSECVCVCMCVCLRARVRVCACVEAGVGEGQSEICNALSNYVVPVYCHISCIVL